MSNRHHRNGIWEGDNKPGSLTEWFAGRNLKGRPKPTPKDESGEFVAEFTAAVLAEMAKNKPTAPATVKPSGATPPVAAGGKGAGNQTTSARVNANISSSSASSNNAPKQVTQVHTVGCTAKAGTNSLSLGDCVCNNCQEDRSAVEKALRKSRLERELKNLEMEEQSKAQPAEATVTPTTPTTPTPRLPRRHASFSALVSEFESAFSFDDDSYSDEEETVTIVDYKTRNFEMPKKKKSCCATCGHTNRSERRHECTTIVEPDAKSNTPKPAAASHPEQRNDSFHAAQGQPMAMPNFVPQPYPVNGGFQHGFPAPPYTYYGVVHPGPSYPPPGTHNTGYYGQGPDRTDLPGPHPYQTSWTAPPLQSMPQGRPSTPEQRRDRPSQSPKRMPRSAMRGSRERERSRSMPPRAPTPPTMSRAATPPAVRWNQSPRASNPPTMSGAGTPPGSRWNQNGPNGRLRFPSGGTSDPSQRQQNQPNGRFTNGRQVNVNNNKFNVGSHRDLHYPPGYSAPANNWRDPETDLSGLQRSGEQRFGNQRTQHFDNNSANRIDMPGAWYSSSDTDSSISWEQTGFDMEYRKWLGRWDATPQRPKPDTTDIERQVSNMMISLPGWANVEADRQKRGPNWVDEQGGRRAPPNVQW